MSDSTLHIGTLASNNVNNIVTGSMNENIMSQGNFDMKA